MIAVISVMAPIQCSVLVLGTQDLLVIDTPDALLVAASSHVEQVKQVVVGLDTDNISQSVSPAPQSCPPLGRLRQRGRL